MLKRNKKKPIIIIKRAHSIAVIKTGALVVNIVFVYKHRLKRQPTREQMDMLV